MRPCMVLLAVIPLLAAGVSAEETIEPPAPGFSLGLEASVDEPRAFRLLPVAGIVGAAELTLLSRLELVPGRGGSGGNGLIGPQQPQLTTVLVFDPVAARKTELRLFRIEQRTWEDMTPWERTGWVMANASAVAGLAVLLGELF